MRNQILQGDVLEMLETLSAESINCIITSPPYFGLRDYGLPPTNWPAVSYAPMAGLPEITIPPMSCCFGLEDTIEAYVGHMVLVWRGLWRVLRGDGVGFLNLGDSYTGNRGYQVPDSKHRDVGNNHSSKIPNGLKPKNLMGIPWRCAFALQADGWYLRSDVIWAKKNGLPESVQDRPTKAHEYVFLLAKSERYWWDQEAIREPNSETGIPYGASKTKNQIEVRSAQGEKLGKSSCFRPQTFEDRKRLATNGRNKRTVWPIATKPFPGAHFAVMPEALVEPCLLAGCPAQVCIECGEPWVRVVEREADNSDYPNGPGGRKKEYEKHNGTLADIARYKTKTIAHTPTCQCSPAPDILMDQFGPLWPMENSTRPGVVLDPFFGSGTVGVVAKKFKRDWAGIELNPDYAEMARTRLDQTQPALFAR